MPCQPHKDALIESAAGGAAPQGDLRVHLDACAACRAAFEQEQALFASIDAGLRVTANAEMPPSLLRRVRSSVDEATKPQSQWVQSLVFASAGVVLALMFFLVARPHRHGSDDQARRIPAVPAPVTAAPEPRRENSLLPAQIASTRATQLRSGKNSTLFHPAASSNPEVLVPADEREGLARFVAALNERGDVVAALLAPAREKKDALVSVDRLQIADMEIETLESKETKELDGAGEKH